MNDVSPTSYSPEVQIVLITIGAISSIISLLIPCLYHIKKQCREHPTNLISNISLLQALSNYNVILIAVNIYKFQQYVNITNIFDIITFNQPEQPTDTQFCQINFILYMILQLSSIAFNICFSIDLFITLKYPFYAGKKRNKFYYLFSLIFLIITIPQTFEQANFICEQEFHLRSIYKIPVVFMIVLGLFYLISFSIILLSYFGLKDVGKIRLKYIQHHRILLYILIGVWICPIWTNILIYCGDQESQMFFIVNLLSFISLLLLGAFVNIARLYHDSYLRSRVIKMLTFKKKKKEFDTESITSNDLQTGNRLNNDVWNVPLANAVSQFSNQKIVKNLIQIVLQSCIQTDGSKYEASNKGRSQSRSNSIVVLSQSQKIKLQEMQKNNKFFQPENKESIAHRFIQKNVQSASLQQLKQISKRNRKFCMICKPEEQIVNQTKNILQERTLFRKDRFIKPLSQQIVQRPTRTLSMSYTSNIQPYQLKRKTTQLNIKTLQEEQKNINLNEQIPLFQNITSKNVQIKVISFAHKIFESIRKLNGIGEFELQQSLNLLKNSENIRKAKQSLGASGSFFFFSYDNKLIIKTIGEGEDQILIKILPSYYSHLKKYKKSLFSKIYGLFSVQIAGVSKITFILIENSFQKFSQKEVIYKKYDLKGSTVARQVKNPNADVLKDINYLKSNDAFILLSKQSRQQLIQQIKKDITLLRNNNIMDYSLLVGVGHLKQPQLSSSQMNTRFYDDQVIKELQQKKILLEEKNKKKQNPWRYIEQMHQYSGKVYSISLIDYLQEFNLNKYLELQLKKIFKGGGDISSIDSELYFQRFMNFVTRITVPINIPVRINKKNSSKQKNQKSSESQKTVYYFKQNQQWENIEDQFFINKSNKKQ